MTDWPKNDANYILYIEWVLMGLFLTMNAADYQLQLMEAAHYTKAGAFPVSSLLAPLFNNLSETSLILIERGAWWLHICGILFFLNYLYYSKHLHILLAFPNTYFGKLTPQGQFAHNETVAREVAMMMDPTADPFAAPAADAPPQNVLALQMCKTSIRFNCSTPILARSVAGVLICAPPTRPGKNCLPERS